jgi:predicted glycogen debranching enzyme
MTFSDRDEWLEPDGLGGFASGTASGLRTRRYHALLLAATTPPTGRVVLVNGVDAWIETPAGRFALSSQRYEPGVVHPDGANHMSAFSSEPWPRWTFAFADGTTIAHDVVVERDTPGVALAWRRTAGHGPCRLFVRPFLSGRDYHALQHENGAFRFEPDRFEPQGGPEHLVWHAYAGIPPIHVLSNGGYRHHPDWYRNFRYEEELARGLDCTEDLASPGEFTWDLEQGEAVLAFGTVVGTAVDGVARPPWIDSAGITAAGVLDHVSALRERERARRAQFPTRLHRAADGYLVKRGLGTTIVAGYPWFTDWGRDTFIALRGICLAADRLDDARRILLEWTTAISKGMLPNRFPDHGGAPEFNSVDASLWFVIAVYDLIEAADRLDTPLSSRDRSTLEDAVDAILEGYTDGTRYGIGADDDGLLAAGVVGVQLTWMDAVVGDLVITPRVGKPVEVQALWLNALALAGRRSAKWRQAFALGEQSFHARFWNEAAGCLYDVVDVDHEAGTVDTSFRPNQIFALGGLPVALVPSKQARRAIDAVEARLWTPLGLRSLAPDEPGYIGHYGGGVLARDGAYHQGTVWPWLLTPFVEAWVRTRGGKPSVKKEARQRFLAPLLRHLDEAGLGHVAEIADGDAPHAPNGCPFQAWSVGEALRLDRVVLATTEPARNRARTAASKSANGGSHALDAR